MFGIGFFRPKWDGPQNWGWSTERLPQNIRNFVPKEADNCGGLEEENKMAVGAQVMLRRNIGTEDGPVHGVKGTIVGFE